MNPKSHQQRLAEQNALIAHWQSQQPTQDTTQQDSPDVPTASIDSANQVQAGNILQQASGMPGGMQSGFNPLQQAHGQGLGPGQTVDPSAIWNGLCEAWAETQAFGKHGLFPSASAAAQHFAQSGQLHQNPQATKQGDLVYFAPDSSNSGFGHVGLISGYDKNGAPLMTSATYNGVKQYSLPDWVKGTGQKVVGFVSPKR